MCLLLAVCCMALTSLASAADFTYRGQLYEQGLPATGYYSLRLSLYAGADSGVRLLGPLTLDRVGVLDGQFETSLHLPALDAARAWLAVEVKAADAAGDFIAIDERSPVDIDGGVCPADWSLTGNAGTTSANVLGTTDLKTLSLVANDKAALRLVPNSLGTAAGPKVIAGNLVNSASAFGATIAGGGGDNAPNVVSGVYGTVGGGNGNEASAEAVVAGGKDNLASGTQSSVGGGFDNHASNAFATVAGGDINTASGYQSAVGGGVSNVAAGTNSVVAGGNGNAAVRIGSTVSGGSHNCAGGSNSWAGGTDAKIRRGNSAPAVSGCEGVPSTAASDGDNNTFMWADDQGSLLSTGPNQFMVRAEGGFWFGSSGTAPPIPAGRLIQTSTGAYLTSGGAWSNASSRTLKEAFATVDPGSILEALVSLPISTWRYRASAIEGRHLGPIAEDFADRFGLGNGNDSISTVDASGVALAAIQGLNSKLEAENARLRADLDALRARVEAVLPPAHDLSNGEKK
jgi:hypothetical protein